MCVLVGVRIPSSCHPSAGARAGRSGIWAYSDSSSEGLDLKYLSQMSTALHHPFTQAVTEPCRSFHSSLVRWLLHLLLICTPNC